MKCENCESDSVGHEADGLLFCCKACALQWAINLPQGDPAWNEVKVGTGLVRASTFDEYLAQPVVVTR